LSRRASQASAAFDFKDHPEARRRRRVALASLIRTQHS
jgi:hypothetical protein